MNIGDRFTIPSKLNGHQHHKGAVYSVTHVYDKFVSAVNLNERCKPEHRTTTSFYKQFLKEFAVMQNAPAEVA